MQLVSEIMSHNVVFVTRDATVRTAVEIFRAHGVDVIPVVDGEQVIGLLDILSACRYDGEVLVAEVVDQPAITVLTDTLLSEAAMLMRRHKLRQIPVVEADRLVGTLSERDLLNAWGVVNDSLTGLPAQYHLRYWVAQKVAASQEVTILFLDLDNFGKFNKEHGHVFGDQILRAVADVLRETVDPAREFVCRYGGDEFAIATINGVSHARDLAAQIRDRLARTCRARYDADVTIAIGIAGGRRERPRPDTHIDSMLDDLLTRASTASTSAKHSAEGILYFSDERNGAANHAAPPHGETSRVVLEGYTLSRLDERVEARVTLRAGEQSYEARWLATEPEAAQALVSATAHCLEMCAGTNHVLRVEDTYEYSTPRGLACIGATVVLTRPDGRTEHLIGTAPLRGDLHRTYIHAVLDATNRRLLR